jgi:diphosphomevalonate decarboxylase
MKKRSFCNMQTRTATAVACANIAFIKYWGNVDNKLRIPTTGSISMNLAGLETRTTVEFSPDFKGDKLVLNGEDLIGEGLARVSHLLDKVRKKAKINDYAHVMSENNFPTGSGIASSASAFAALSLAASKAAGLSLKMDDLSRLARTSSGSASRSIPGGFVEWIPGDNHETSLSHTIAPPDHWALADCVAIISQAHKETGSTDGHAIAHTSPLQTARIADASRRLNICRQAILDRDFSTFAEIVELDSNMMHAVIMTSTPNLMYLEPTTLTVIEAVKGWRKNGLEVCYTIDAGPNIHVICPQDISSEVAKRLGKIPRVTKVLTALPGSPARLV